MHIQYGDDFFISPSGCLDAYSDFVESAKGNNFLFMPIITMSYFSDEQRMKEYKFFLDQESKNGSVIIFPIIYTKMSIFSDLLLGNDIFSNINKRECCNWWVHRSDDDLFGERTIVSFCSNVVMALMHKHSATIYTDECAERQPAEIGVVSEVHQKRAFDRELFSSKISEFNSSKINVGIGSYLKEFSDEEGGDSRQMSKRENSSRVKIGMEDNVGEVKKNKKSSEIIINKENFINDKDNEIIKKSSKTLEVISKKKDEFKDLRGDSRSNIIIVDSSGHGDYISLALAVMDAGDGCVIYLMPGEYEGCVRIKKNISIIGKGRNEEIRITASYGCIIEISGGDSPVSARIENVSILRNAKCYSPHAAVQVKNSEVMLKQCNVLNIKGCALYVMEAGRLVVEKSNIRSFLDSGVRVSENSDALIVECRIEKNKKFGVVIEKNSNAIIKKSNIANSGQSGVLFQFNSIGVIEKSNIFGNQNSGVSIYGGASAIVKENSCYKNSRFGIEVVMGAGGVFYGNKTYENSLGAFHACDESKRYCIIKKHTHK